MNGQALVKLINEETIPRTRNYRAKQYAKADIGHLNDRQIQVIKMIGIHPNGLSISELTQESSSFLKKSGIDSSASSSSVANAINSLCWELDLVNKSKLPPPNQKITCVKLTKTGQMVYEKVIAIDAERASLYAKAAGKNLAMLVGFFKDVNNLLDEQITLMN